ncbi:AcrR family transcriptional regulator [Nocardioides daedukensis]|uniref:AcrR family transcriptional regulator n=1 Tax=Nocardioides daedukensis TaxID=634462 RepID=A0A7Y9S003_9ACTN|nr:TetR/AcrR family transcriptional regulator C-terminal domain-containing protein [Nocardioides daedukensis]NYG57080.1 AcrR family transcriptional regulator [Nocardioides daedukensis]
MDASPTPVVRRGRPPRGTSTLSRTAVVEATLRVSDADGIAAVSMRSVARELGVDPKSLYNHVHDKEDLLDAIAEHVLGGLDFPPATGDLATDLRAIAHGFRERALLHPEAAYLVLTRPLGSLEALAPVEAVLGVLHRAGFAAPESVHLLRSLLATVVGTLLREVSAGPTYGSADEAVVADRQAVLGSSGLPSVAAAAADLARFDREQEFSFTVDLAIEAVANRVPTQR